MNKFKKWQKISLGCVLLLLIGLGSFLVYISHGKVTTSQPMQVFVAKEHFPSTSWFQMPPSNCIRDVVVVDGKENELHTTYQDMQKELESVKKQDAPLLKLMREEWKLEELTNSNWESYWEYVGRYGGGLPSGKMNDDQYREQFLHVQTYLSYCEGEKINQKTLKYIDFANFMLKTKLVKQVRLDPIATDFVEGPTLEKYYGRG